MVIWVLSGIALLILIIVISGYPRLNHPRQPGDKGPVSREIAQAYDRLVRMPQFKLIRRIFAGKLAKHHPRGTLVDVGCGPGYLIALMAARMPHLHIIGVDIAEEMGKVAAQNLSPLVRSQQVELRQGDVQKLPFADNAVDFVVSTLSLHEWSEPEAALREIHRILKPGGQLLLLDLRRDARRIFYGLIRFAQTFVVASVMRQANEPMGSILSSYTPAELNDLLAKAPFPTRKIEGKLGWMFAWAGKD